MLSDLRYSWRRLRKSKTVTVAVVLTLALCIGANALIFSMLYALVLRPLPFPDPGRVVEIYNSYPKSGQTAARGNVAQYLDYAKHPELFSAVGLYHVASNTVTGKSGPIQVGAAWVTPSFFDLLGIKPVVGRFFDADFVVPGNDQYVVLTESYWAAHFSSDPKVIGQKFIYDDTPYTIVGVAPRAIEALNPNLGVLRPISWRPNWLDGMSRHSRDFSLVGRLFARLQPGISLDQAATRVTAIDRSYYDTASAEYQRYVDRSGYHSVVHLLQDNQSETRKPVLYLLQAGALLVLVIGCVNVTNLLLARAAARQSELALRHALGASPWTIARQLLLESGLLAAGGGTAGIAISLVGIGLVNRLGGALLPYGFHLSLSAPMLVFALGVSGVVSISIGVAPVFFMARRGLFQDVQRNTRNASQNRRRRLLGAMLVSGQVALSAMLLVAAGLLIRSLVRAASVDPGFDAAQIVTTRVILPGSVIPNTPNAISLEDRIVRSLQEIPGVEAVGLATETPMADLYRAVPMFIQDAGNGSATSQPMVRYPAIARDYFRAMGIPVLRGRPFDARDDADQVNSVIIDRRIADKYFPNEDPIGRRVAFDRLPGPGEEWDTIVGVVGATNYAGLDVVNTNPVAYIPLRKYYWPGNSYFVRSRRAADDLLPLIRARMLAANPSLALSNAGAMQTFLDDSLAMRQAILALLAGFAGIALLLAGVGVYSVLAYDVSQRTLEIGIRGALGASPREIQSLILRQGLWETGVGLGAGVIGALLLGQLMRGLLFDVDASDPPTLVAIAGILFGIGLVASLLPAWRAARIDPIVALRCE